MTSGTGRGTATGRQQPVTEAVGRLDAEYVLPLKWVGDAGVDELTDYLRELAGWLDVTVVDGSPASIFAEHRLRWAQHVRHIPPEQWPGRNGKVAGVVTGVRAARHERVVIADDDVRWRRPQLQRALQLLEQVDLVRPQNYFCERPWHARWDTGRSLLNRALGADYPGTYVLRRSRFLSMGGYDGDVLFENLELSRTVRAAGGREQLARSIFVARVPPNPPPLLEPAGATGLRRPGATVPAAVRGRPPPGPVAGQPPDATPLRLVGAGRDGADGWWSGRHRGRAGPTPRRGGRSLPEDQCALGSSLDLGTRRLRLDRGAPTADGRRAVRRTAVGHSRSLGPTTATPGGVETQSGEVRP